MSTIHTKLKIGAASDVEMSQDTLLQAEAILQSEITVIGESPQRP